MRSSVLAILLALTGACTGASAAPGQCLSAQEFELVRLVNEYRVANGLQPVVTSRWLSTTAQWHVWDRIANPSAVGGACNTHSWSHSPPPGVTWQGMCYTSDHAQAAQMWAKPRQISVNRYGGNGYELAADTSGTQTAAQALWQWQHSPGHNAVILQQGAWANVTFRGLGAGISAGYAVLWFGDALDTDVAMLPCSDDGIHTNGFEV